MGSELTLTGVRRRGTSEATGRRGAASKVSRAGIMGLMAGAAGIAYVIAPPAATASSDGLDARWTFTSQQPYFETTDRHGTFNAQVRFGGPRRSMIWTFVISPAVAAIATGDMDCTAGHGQLDYSDRHPSIPPGYLWHSTVQGHQLDRDYTLWGNCRFPVQVSGKPGLANVNFHFDYRLAGTAGQVGYREAAASVVPWALDASASTQPVVTPAS